MKQRDGGFTLIELLVVIAIIAILAAVLFPVFTAAKAKAKQTACASNMKQVTQAMLRYADDYEGFLPPLNCYWMYEDGLPVPPDGPDGDENHTWDDVTNGGSLTPYLKNKDILCCPADPYHLKAKDLLARVGDNAIAPMWTYTMNGYMTREDPLGYNSKDDANEWGMPTSYSKQPTKTILLVDENVEPRHEIAEYRVNDAVFINADRTTNVHPGRPNREYYVGGYGTKTTSGSANECYLDSHIGVLPCLLQWDKHPEIFRR